MSGTLSRCWTHKTNEVLKLLKLTQSSREDRSQVNKQTNTSIISSYMPWENRNHSLAKFTKTTTWVTLFSPGCIRLGQTLRANLPYSKMRSMDRQVVKVTRSRLSPFAQSRSLIPSGTWTGSQRRMLTGTHLLKEGTIFLPLPDTWLKDRICSLQLSLSQNPSKISCYGAKGISDHCVCALCLDGTCCS